MSELFHSISLYTLSLALSLAFVPRADAQTAILIDALPELEIITAENAGELQELLTVQREEVMSLALSPDRKTLAVNGFTNIWLYDLEDIDSPPRVFEVDYVRTIAFSPNGKLLASGGIDRELRLWDIETGKLTSTLKGHVNGINTIAFNPDGTLIASGDGDLVSTGTSDFWPTNDNTVRLWDVASGKQQAIVKDYGAIVNVVAFSPDATKLMVGDDFKRVKAWDIEMLLKLAETNEDTATTTLDDVVLAFGGGVGGVYGLAFSPDGALLAACGAAGIVGGYVYLWDFNTGTVRSGQSTSRNVMNVQFNWDGTLIIYSDLSGTLAFRDVSSDTEIASFRRPEDTLTSGSLAVSHDGRLLVTGSREGKVRFWGIPTK